MPDQPADRPWPQPDQGAVPGASRPEPTTRLDAPGAGAAAVPPPPTTPAGPATPVGTTPPPTPARVPTAPTAPPERAERVSRDRRSWEAGHDAAPAASPARTTPRPAAEGLAGPDVSGPHLLLEHALFEMKKVIVGQDRAIERMFVCLLAGGHCLIEGVPGLAKTLAVETLATVVGGSFARLQFTPDLLPADIMGTRIYRGSTETFDIELGPVFVNFLLTDEINRAPAKVQSALLEVMAEHQVSIGGKTFPVPSPFLVLATQNPIEQEGVYPLPEAQRDRFLMKVVVGYPSAVEELEIVHRMGVHPPHAEQRLTLEQLVGLQQAADDVYVDHGVVDYAVNLVLATREPGQFHLPELVDLISFGASPRASLGLIAGARALALMRGRNYALPQDVFDIAPDVLRHRLVLSYEALAQGLVVDQIVTRLLSTVPAPRIAPSQDPGPAAYAGYAGATAAPAAGEQPVPGGWARPNS